jgi:hypothetical protein
VSKKTEAAIDSLYFDDMLAIRGKPKRGRTHLQLGGVFESPDLFSLSF